VKKALSFAFSFFLSAALVRAQAWPGATDGNAERPVKKYTAAFSLSPENPASKVNGTIKIPSVSLTGSLAYEQADSSKTPEVRKKRTSTAIAETIVFNFFIWAFDQYVDDAEYSYVSLETMDENLAH
jgi:hypothetical protein